MNEDNRHPLAAPDYEYGDRRDELRHAYREMEQYQLALQSGVISQREYEKGVTSVRRRHGMLGWSASHDGP